MRWSAIAILVVGVLLLLSEIPVEEAMVNVQGWLQDLGVWGFVAFVAIYVAATVLMLPGSAITLGGGAAFGLGWGTVAVVIGSNIGAALAFLISRYLARGRFERRMAANSKFAAIDRAIARGGWKIVALLRLSPAVPFNLQNYLYGLTGIRFLTCVVTSAIAMLPGTFMYVYIGVVGREAALVAGGGGESQDALKGIMLIIGVVATIAVSVYITKIARRELAKHVELEPAADGASDSSDDGPSAAPPRRPWALLAVAIVALACGACLKVRSVMGPPEATLREAYEESTVTGFDHADFDAVLRQHVDAGGFVDYAALAADSAGLDGYIAALAEAPWDELGRDEKLALLLNAYNAFTLRLILDHWPVESIRDIPASERWKAKRWKVGPHTWSLDDIEHQEIRPKFKEARIHFALVCAAVSCPPLRSEAYRANRLDAQLEDQTRFVHSHAAWFRIDDAEAAVWLTPLYDWYGGDFEQVAGSVEAFAARYSEKLKNLRGAGKTHATRFLPYDWRLNGRDAAAPR